MILCFVDREQHLQKSVHGSVQTDQGRNHQVRSSFWFFQHAHYHYYYYIIIVPYENVTCEICLFQF